jgi:hypothetical protein
VVKLQLKKNVNANVHVKYNLHSCNLLHYILLFSSVHRGSEINMAI